jgi:hypothetical protein
MAVVLRSSHCVVNAASQHEHGQVMTNTDNEYRVRAVDVEATILTIRGQKVILDADLARVYGVPTKALNQAVKRNADRFPPDFLIRLTEKEVADTWSQIVTTSGNRSQIVTGSQKHRDPRFLPYAFTGVKESRARYIVKRKGK